MPDIFFLEVIFVFPLYIGLCPIYNNYVNQILTGNIGKREIDFRKKAKIIIYVKNVEKFWDFCEKPINSAKFFKTTVLNCIEILIFWNFDVKSNNIIFTEKKCHGEPKSRQSSVSVTQPHIGITFAVFVIEQ